MARSPAILIHGPTASGKTRLAIALARRLDGVVINADAMQVYRDLEVLTARPDPEELAQAPHVLFGHVDAGEVYSVARWLEEAVAAIEAAWAAGRTPILVGGTGLYLQALVEGLAPIPEVADAVRQSTRAQVAQAPADAHAELARIDPAAGARIAPGDRQRLARALEVYASTGRPISSFQTEARPALAKGEWVGVALTPRRRQNYDRIDVRVTQMLAAGVLDEVRDLWRRQLSPELPAMRAHGMPGFCAHFDGACGLDEALDRCRRDTRRYAKRQMTWIAHRFTLWPRVPSEELGVRVRAILALHEEIDRHPATG